MKTQARALRSDARATGGTKKKKTKKKGTLSLVTGVSVAPHPEPASVSWCFLSGSKVQLKAGAMG